MLIKTKIERSIYNEDGDAWYAYFQGTPTKEDLEKALLSIYPSHQGPMPDPSDPNDMYGYNPALAPEGSILLPGIERWFICQAV